MELALLLPLLMLIVLGCVDFGRLASTYVAVINASRTGASYGALNPYVSTSSSQAAVWQEQIRLHVVADLRGVLDADSSFGESYLQVAASRTPEPGAMWLIHVEVSYPFRTLVPWPGIPSQMTLSQTVQMRGIR